MTAVKAINGQIEVALFPSVVCEMIDFADSGTVSEKNREVHVAVHLAMCAACTQRLAGFCRLN